MSEKKDDLPVWLGHGLLWSLGPMGFVMSGTWALTSAAIKKWNKGKPARDAKRRHKEHLKQMEFHQQAEITKAREHREWLDRQPKPAPEPTRQELYHQALREIDQMNASVDFKEAMRVKAFEAYMS